MNQWKEPDLRTLINEEGNGTNIVSKLALYNVNRNQRLGLRLRRRSPSAGVVTELYVFNCTCIRIPYFKLNESKFYDTSPSVAKTANSHSRLWAMDFKAIILFVATFRKHFNKRTCMSNRHLQANWIYKVMFHHRSCTCNYKENKLNDTSQAINFYLANSYTTPKNGLKTLDSLFAFIELHHFCAPCINVLGILQQLVLSKLHTGRVQGSEKYQLK